MTKHALPEHEVVVLVSVHQSYTSLFWATPNYLFKLKIWKTLMDAVEWNKKEELVAEQALKHLKLYTPLLAAFATQGRSELALLVRVQEFCFEDMNFMKVFQKIVVLFYKGFCKFVAIF